MIEEKDVEVSRENPHSLLAKAINENPTRKITFTDIKLYLALPESNFSKGLETHSEFKEIYETFASLARADLSIGDFTKIENYLTSLEKIHIMGSTSEKAKK